MRWRRFEELFARTLMAGAALVMVLSLALILGTIIVKGLPALSLEMLTQSPRGGYYVGRGGGILNAILGSLAMALLAALFAALLSLPVALYLNVYRRRGSRVGTVVRIMLDVLWGIPSIVYGAFGFAVMTYLGMRASLLAGALTLGLLITPIMIRGMDEVMKTVPFALQEAALAMGATRLETALEVIVRQTFPGILTAILLALGRGMGDAAAVLFTAGFTDALPTSLFKPVASLPLAIFFQLGTPFPEVQQRGYAAALVLTAIVLCISLAGRLLSRRLSRHVLR